MQGLQTLIDQIERGRNIHISILDLSGILNTPSTKIEFKNIIHSKKFCDVAKSTECGYRVCLMCKRNANMKAIKLKKAFCGQCSFGLYEAAVPLVMKDSIMAIVYVGNAVVDEERTLTRLKKACRYSEVPEEELREQLKNCERIEDTNELYQIGEIVSDYLKMLYTSTPKNKAEFHWLVSLMKSYADEMFCNNITLKELAATYHKNDKYIGRLFKREMGISFDEYCIELRLQKAETLLLDKNEKIINVALACGFDSISYFNRLFKRKHGISPSQYRKSFS